MTTKQGQVPNHFQGLPLKGQQQEPLTRIQPTTGPTYLSVDRCPSHGFWAICVGDDVGGRRLTPSKCCGSWQTVSKWKVTPEQLREIVNDLECVADNMERATV